MPLSPSFFRGKRVFITGHTGFKGAWLTRILVNSGAIVTGYSLAPPTRPNLFSLADLEHTIHHVIGDVRDRNHLKKTYLKAAPQIVLHLAAQPLVRTGYENPYETYEINVMGTLNLLECIREEPRAVKSIVNVTTDKVYLNQEWCWGYREIEPLNGYDPYSNSKSCSDLMTQCYFSSFFKDLGIAVSTVRAGNVIGGGDFSKDRIIPDCFRAVEQGEAVSVRNPHSIRPYQHVLEPLFAYLLIAETQYQDLSKAGSYNVGPDDHDCVTTGALVDLFCEMWGHGASRVNKAEANAPHEAMFLKLECSKLKTVFNWNPVWSIREAMNKTIDWHRAYLDKELISKVMDQQIYSYLKRE